MLAFRFQKDRKNAAKAFSVYNLDFQMARIFLRASLRTQIRHSHHPLTDVLAF